MSEGFLERWSRRKQEAQANAPSVSTKSTPEALTAPPLATQEVAAPQPPASDDSLTTTKNEGSDSPSLTLADVEGLGVESDYKPFLAKGIAPEVKNAAFRKLFSDPHFNVMDGLDTYIDDYSKPMPMSDTVLRQMASAKFLKLFGEESEGSPPETPKSMEKEDVAESDEPGNLPSPPVANTQPASQETDDHHADMQLQPDDATRAEDARRGAG